MWAHRQMYTIKINIILKWTITNELQRSGHRRGFCSWWHFPLCEAVVLLGSTPPPLTVKTSGDVSWAVDSRNRCISSSFIVVEWLWIPGIFCLATCCRCHRGLCGNWERKALTCNTPRHQNEINRKSALWFRGWCFPLLPDHPAPRFPPSHFSCWVPS